MSRTAGIITTHRNCIYISWDGSHEHTIPLGTYIVACASLRFGFGVVCVSGFGAVFVVVFGVVFVVVFGPSAALVFVFGSGLRSCSCSGSCPCSVSVSGSYSCSGSCSCWGSCLVFIMSHVHIAQYTRWFAMMLLEGP